jgi:hypothetical protein
VASISYPRAGYNSGAISSVEHERLTHPTAPDGVYGTPADQPLAYADGTGTRVVKIRNTRYALVRGSLYDSGASDISITLDANSSGNPRIDMIVLRLDRSGYTVTETKITGTAAASPSPPALTYNTGATGFWDFPVAEVAVANGATALAAGTVTPRAWYTNDDGIILCTATTRPQHQAGRRMYQTDTGLWYFSDGSSWKIDGAWTASQTAGAAVSSLSFTGIPTNLKKLEVHWTARDDWAGFAGATGYLRVNNDAGGNYRHQLVQGSGDGVNATAFRNAAWASGDNRGGFGLYARGGAAAGVFGSGTVTFPAWNAPHTNHLAYLWQSVTLSSSTGQSWHQAGGGMYAGAGPYNRIDFFPESASQKWAAGTQFTLYGWE